MNTYETTTSGVYGKTPYERTLNLLGASVRAKRHYLSVKQGWPRHLFKYKPCDEAHLKSFIVDSNFYLSSRSQLNDPFDVQSVIEFEEGAINASKYRNRLYKEHKPRHKKRKEIASRLSSPDRIQAGIKKSLIEAIDTSGFHSFSTEPRHLLMWSHYADAHRGLCLMFSTALDLDVFISALPVNYSKNFPIIHYRQDIAGDLVRNAFLTKSIEWSYEKERRIFEPDLANKFLHFDPAALVGIILGSKISKVDEGMIANLLDARKSKR